MLSFQSKVIALAQYSLIPDHPLSGALRELIDVAESTLSALAERDLLVARYKEQQEIDECKNYQDHASGSGTRHHEDPHDSDAS